MRLYHTTLTRTHKQQVMTYHTIVIGAGWSGVIAAHELTKRGCSVLVLEARNRVGGRARTHVEGMHAPVDLGCTWIQGALLL